jgi:hypothetical protein
MTLNYSSVCVTTQGVLTKREREKERKDKRKKQKEISLE